MDFGLKGKTAFVTGGSRGIGKASALALAEHGVDVAICGRTRETLDEAVAEIQAKGARACGPWWRRRRRSSAGCSGDAQRWSRWACGEVGL